MLWEVLGDGKICRCCAKPTSSLQANLHPHKEIFFPTPSADVTGVPCSPWLGCPLVFTVVSPVGTATLRQWVVKTATLMVTFQCSPLLGAVLGAGDTVMGLKPHRNPAPMDFLVSADPPKQTNQYIMQEVMSALRKSKAG